MRANTQYVSALGNSIHHEHATAASYRRIALAAVRNGQRQNAGILHDKAAKHDRQMGRYAVRLMRPI